MLVVSGTVTAKPETFEELLEAALAHVRRSRGEVGCLQHGVSIDAEDPMTLVFYEEWEDRETLEAHFKVPGSLEFLETVRNLTDRRGRMKILPVAPRD